MKTILIIFFLIPVFCFAQFAEITQSTSGRIGQFLDEENNSQFSLSKNKDAFDLCFYNKVKIDSKTQTMCLNIKEDKYSMLEFYNTVAEFFDVGSDSFPNKYLENNQYRITITKSGNFINLEFYDKSSTNKNNFAVTSKFSKNSWKKLFGQN